MPNWVSISLAILSALFALQQIRMFRIYRGHVYSATIGAMEPNPTLSAIAVRSAITFAIFVPILLLVPLWRALTYVTLVWVCRAVVDVFLCLAGAAHYDVTTTLMTPKGRRWQVIGEVAKVVGNGVWFGVCVYFFGF